MRTLISSKSSMNELKNDDSIKNEISMIETIHFKMNIF